MAVKVQTFTGRVRVTLAGEIVRIQLLDNDYTLQIQCTSLLGDKTKLHNLPAIHQLITAAMHDYINSQFVNQAYKISRPVEQ